MTPPHPTDSDPPVDRCPWCEEDGRDVRGTIDYRIKVDGRYVYRCPEDREHRWQDANEAPSEKGFVRLRKEQA